MPTPTIISSQPMGLRTRRTISAPRLAYATVEAELPMFEIASFASKVTPGQGRKGRPGHGDQDRPAHMPSIRRVFRRAVWPARPAVRAPAVWPSAPAVMTSSRAAPPAG